MLLWLRRLVVPRSRGARAAAVLVLAFAMLRWRFRSSKNAGLVRRVVAYVYSLRSPSYSHVDVIDSVQVPMRDGVELSMTVLLPNAAAQGECRGETFPLVFMRTPYDRHLVQFIAQRFAERGMSVVVQDTRGRFESDGDFDIIKDEANDGEGGSVCVCACVCVCVCVCVAGVGSSSSVWVLWAMVGLYGLCAFISARLISDLLSLGHLYSCKSAPGTLAPARLRLGSAPGFHAEAELRLFIRLSPPSVSLHSSHFMRLSPL